MKMERWHKDGDQWLAGSFRIMTMWSRAHGKEYLLSGGPDKGCYGSFATLSDAKARAEIINRRSKANDSPT